MTRRALENGLPAANCKWSKEMALFSSCCGRGKKMAIKGGKTM